MQGTIYYSDCYHTNTYIYLIPTKGTPTATLVGNTAKIPAALQGQGFDMCFA